MKTIKELEAEAIENNRKQCKIWYDEGRKDMKKDVLGLIAEFRVNCYQEKADVNCYQEQADILFELKAMITG